MGRRAWSGMAMMVAGLAAMLTGGCTSPGTPYSYLDVKLASGVTASPLQPVAGQATTIGFVLRNTWNQPMTAVAWELRENSDPLVPTSGAVVASGAVDIAAFASSAQVVALGGLARGTHTYAVILDPLNAIAERDEGNNVAQVAVVVADQDISFGAPAPTITGPGGAALTSADTATPLTLNFAGLDTVNVAQTAPIAVDVPYTITVNGLDITPASSKVSFDPTGLTPPVAITTPVTVTLPAAGSAGTFVYTITLVPTDGDDSLSSDNTATVVVTIPAPG